MAKRKSSFRLLPVLAALLIAPLAVPAHASTHLLNLYVGASLGHASLRAKDSSLISSSLGSLGSFDRNDFAYQFTAGVRWLHLLGAEVDYFHLGSGGVSPAFSGVPGVYGLSSSLTSAHISQEGVAAFAVLYLPVRVVDIYVKAGVARLTTALNASVAHGSTCPPDLPLGPCFPIVNGAVNSMAETTLAAGAGVQWNLGDWAVRGEYEQFDALGEHPDLLTVGVIWTIL